MWLKRKGFTIVELLVVLGIIAILLAIVLPALSYVREQARTAVCASNLEQLYQAEIIYANNYRNYLIPAEAGSGAATNYYWWGTKVLGAAYGFDTTYKTSSQKMLIVERISKMLICPSSDRQFTPDDIYLGDYCYNTNLGDIRAEIPSDPEYAKYAPWAFFKLRNQVPGNVLIAIDAAPLVAQNDDRFEKLNDLTKSSDSRPYPRAGAPHHGKANMLFFDGSVRQGMASKDLANWMILAPGNLDNPKALYYTTNKNNVWQPGRPLPF
jgi:prepilin-type N-terminal cleavage/methylation domain-containing protein/prepilin-type processing-associated H-X9-DG protein